MEMKEINISVGTLAEEWGRLGDLNRLAGSFRNAPEGIKAHRRIQKSRPAGYEKEVPVECAREQGKIRLKIKGRIDGVFTDLQPVLIEEIKTTYYELEGFSKREESVHWSQARIYAYIYACKNNLPAVGIQVTCASLASKKVLEEKRVLSFRELEEYFLAITDRLISWHRRLEEWRITRDNSLSDVPFPFPEYRTGQRELAVAAWKAVTNSRQLLVQAPTGTGKTVASLYPAIKVFPSGRINKVIYLTARTTGQEVVESCLDLIREKGGRIKSVTLTAKEKICRGGGICTGDECEYARGYYDRLDEARDVFFSHEDFTRARIEEVSAEYNLCPYVFSRELHKWADCIICDSNYVFDPAVAAGVLPGEIGKSALIVDEAHNLIDRARDNFSASLNRSLFLGRKGKIKRRLQNLLKKADDLFLVIFSPGSIKPEEPDPLFLKVLRDLGVEIERILLKDISLEPQVREMLFESWCELNHFLEVAEFFGPEYKLLLQPEGAAGSAADSSIKLFNMDPSSGLRETLDTCRSAIFLSGTLQPIEYYRWLNGCREDSLFLELPSPYPPENLCTLVYPSLSTRYIDRKNSLESLAGVITDFINSRRGNYLVYFPSYAYLQMVTDLIESRNGQDRPAVEGEICRQAPGMNDHERSEFLSRFSAENHETLVGMAVMGGVFGEGIDLVGERLTGVVIVGVGLPSISDERDCIRKYFDGKGINGFVFSYLVPGMTKVLQAAGRVIRSETDRGVILLIDDRFKSCSYRSLFPSYWNPKSVRNRKSMQYALEKFWEKMERETGLEPATSTLARSRSTS